MAGFLTGVLTGLDYELVPVDTLKGEQHQPAFRAINPNGKLPAIGDGGKRVFDSHAILLIFLVGLLVVIGLLALIF